MAALISELDVFLVYLLLFYQTVFCCFGLLVYVVELIVLRVGFWRGRRGNWGCTGLWGCSRGWLEVWARIRGGR